MNKTIVKYFLFLILSLNVYADEIEIEQLKTQVKILSERLDAYDKKTESTKENIVDDVSGSEAPMKQGGVLELKSSDTILSVGGRIQFHSIYASPEGAFYAGKIPLKKDSLGEKGQLIMSARDSRLWVKTRTPSEYGPVRALIEIDFLGVSGTETNTNSHGLRLRHAYVEGNGFTFGQTNSAFNSNVTLDTISYAVNDTLVRQPLIRYSIDDRLLAYDISFEQPETTLLDPDGNIITPKDDLLPDIIARVRYYPSWGEMSSALLARYIKQDHTKLSNGNDVNSSDTAIAWGVNISAKIKTYKLDDIRFDAQYGKGMGRYIAYNAYAAGSIDANGDIKLQPAFGAHIGYRHWWSETLRSTFAYSYTGTNNNLDDLNVTNLDRVNKDVYSWQLNLLWTPVKNGLAGIEYARALRNVESDERGEMDLLILLLRYDF